MTKKKTGKEIHFAYLFASPLVITSPESNKNNPLEDKFDEISFKEEF